TQTKKENLYVKSNAIWSPPVIEVCWENPGPYDAERTLVQSMIEESWQANSGVRFVGWGQCFPESRGVRILISDSNPLCYGLGAELDGRSPGMVLNFTFENWSPVCNKPENKEACLRVFAVHEFGHALGFAHEDARPDTPSWCGDQPGQDGHYVIGPWDEYSVM